jgi:hypothetical protein
MAPLKYVNFIATYVVNVFLEVYLVISKNNFNI